MQPLAYSKQLLRERAAPISVIVSSDRLRNSNPLPTGIHVAFLQVKLDWRARVASLCFAMQRRCSSGLVR